uniref:Uncharacterized protein n=1 Tax=Knipowitschia caucasica TaxID=637954 RepID=A0AAV2M3T2_KNICA
MQGAIDEVRQAGSLMYRQAAVHFWSPSPPLRDRVSGKVASDSTYGQRPLLSEKMRFALVEYCLTPPALDSHLTKSQVVTHALAIFQPAPPTNTKGGAEPDVVGQTSGRDKTTAHHQDPRYY